MNKHDFYRVLVDFDRADQRKEYNNMTTAARLKRFSYYVAQRQQFYNALQGTIKNKLVVLDDECATLDEYMTEAMNYVISRYFKLDDELKEGVNNG